MNNFYLISNHIYLGFKMFFVVILKWMHIMSEDHNGFLMFSPVVGI